MAFTPENLLLANEILARYPKTKSAILPLAHLAQDQDGYLTQDAMREIAGMIGVTPAEVLGTCSFYTMFKRDEVGRLVVSVCTNVTCLVMGGPEVLEHLEQRYASDKEVTIEEVECLAACGNAPAMQVNYEFHESLTPGSATEIIEAYKSGELTARGVSGGVAGGGQG